MGFLALAALSAGLAPMLFALPPGSAWRLLSLYSIDLQSAPPNPTCRRVRVERELAALESLPRRKPRSSSMIIGGLLGTNILGNPWPVTLTQIGFATFILMACVLYASSPKAGCAKPSYLRKIGSVPI